MHGLGERATRRGGNLKVIATQQHTNASEGLVAVQDTSQALVHGDQHVRGQHGHLVHDQQARLGEGAQKLPALVVGHRLEQVVGATALGHAKAEEAAERAGPEAYKGGCHPRECGHDEEARR
jgi:hypothetical protein